MPRKRQKKDTKCIPVNISIDERLLDKIDTLIQDPKNLYFAGNRSAFIKHAILQLLEQLEKNDRK